MRNMNTINREQFEAWLFSQPDERNFAYIEGQPDAPTGCLVCNFLRENTNHKHFGVSGAAEGFRVGFEDCTKFEPWLELLLRQNGFTEIFTAKYSKDTYLKLFPERASVEDVGVIKEATIQATNAPVE